MKKTELQEIRNKSIQDLRKQLGESQKELAHMKLEIAIGKQTNLRVGYHLRKKRAVLQTIIREKEMGGKES